MAFIFHKKPIAYSAKTLSTLLEKFKPYTEEISPNGDDSKQHDELTNAVNLITGGIKLIQQSRDALQSLVNKLEKEFDELKLKGNRKELVNEVEEIDNETHFNEKIASSNDMIYVLETRVNEARSKANKIAQKLGVNQEKNETNTSTTSENALSRGNSDNLCNDDTEREFSANDAAWLSEDVSETGLVDREDIICRTLKPQQLKLPRFFGDEEEFSEFWAVFESLVHENKVLSTIEKLLLLKDSLKGKAELAVKGIQLVPKNYPWMINALKKKYGNKPINRAKVVQKLVDLRPAANNAESCTYIFDKIRVLINQMVSAGQDIRKMQDALWTEKILEKFPYSIVKNVLITTQEMDEIRIDDIMDALEKQIEAKKYVESRLRNFSKFDHPKKRSDNTQRDISNVNTKSCVFCKAANHESANCKTVTDVQARRNMVREEKLCWKCFSNDHNSNHCAKPNCTRCGRMHDITLCFPTNNTTERNPNQRVTPSNRHSGYQRPQGRSEEEQDMRTNRPPWRNNHSNDARDRMNRRHTVNNTCLETGTNNSSQITRNLEQIVLMTAEGNLWNHKTNQFEKVLFFFDTGAQKSLIRESTADDFGLVSQQTEHCTMSGIGGHTERFKSNLVTLRVSTAFGKQIDLTVRTKPIITNGFSSVRLSEEDKQFLQFKEMFVCNPRVRGEFQNPHILIGLDYYYELVPPNTTTVQTPSGLQITNTVFGPSIHGKGALSAFTTNEGTAMHGLALIEEIDETQSTETTIHQLTVINDSNESQILEKMFELEGLGISQEELQKDESTFSYFQSYSKKLSFKNGFATAPLPLKDSVVDLSDNYSVAYRRLMSLWQQLQMNEQQRTWYNRVLEKYLQENVIEEAKNDISNNVGTYYMPHSGVWRPSKAVPLRIVFDASSKKKACFSLNDVIYTGETFVNKIHDLLISSRLSELILLCDIEAAFTQVRLHHTHKDLCRFLWVKNADKPPTRDNIIEYRFTRLPFGLTASPSILNMVILAYLNQKDTPLAREIASHLYVDNILLKASNDEEAIAKYRESKAIFAEIGMNLREYISNSRTVNAAIPENDRLQGKVIKFLGVKYDVEKDEYALDIRIPTKEKLTKRDIVSQLNSVYDPVGIAGPLLVKLKSLMRDIYSTKTDWKDTIPFHLAQKWNETCQQINDTSITIPRKALAGHDYNDRRHTLWVFSDASKIAIATSAYLQSERYQEVTQLISGKTRLTPKKITQTIPRLELLGILIAMRLAKTITSTLCDSIKNVKIASDSEIALAWVPSTRKLPPFVSSQRDRIARLKLHLESEGVQVQFYHVPTDKNPADAGTRGLTGETIKEHDWIRGPRWLTVNPEKWPLKVITAASAGKDDDYSEETQAYVTVSPPADSDNEKEIINLSQFSKYTKVLRTMATIGKLLNRWTRKCRFYSEEKIATVKEFDTQHEITAHDINNAEKLLIASIHRNISSQELQKRFHNMKIIQDENGIIRHESRIQNAVLPHDTKSPIYIPNPSDIARLILTHIHCNNAHCGNDQILALARQRFWIPQPMKAIKKYVKGCAICKRCHGLPYGAPEMPPLPNDRVIIAKPFQKIGCDFLGPFESNNQEKMYVCLYTCLTTRAVHLEAVENLSAGAFLNCFIRFISRRGVPQLVRTDCGTNFKLGQKIIDKLFEKDELHENSVMTYSATERIRWIFNPPGAPWMGGVWERLVGSVKRSFTKAVGRKKLTFTELNTVIARIEAIINTRPLTKMSSSEISEIPLRPIDFLQGNVRYALPSPITNASDPEYDPELIQTAAQAKEAMQFSEITSTKFWDRWNSEYLTVLRDSQKRHLNQPRHTTSTPQIGEIVVIEQELIPRGDWVYGKILSLIPSTDGLIRSAKILMPNQKILQRPLNKIFPLEISSGPETENEEPREQIEEIPLPTSENAEQNEAINATQPAETNTSRNRKNPERASKTRAYEVIQNFERSLEGPTTPSCSKLMTMITLAAMMCLGNCEKSQLERNFTCNRGAIKIQPIPEAFQVCVEKMCKEFFNTTQALVLKIPPTSNEEYLNVTLTMLESNGSQTVTCRSPSYCDHSSGLMTKSLLGNPHCWPMGALMTIGCAIYATTATILVNIWIVRFIIARIKCSKISIERDLVLESFNPRPLNLSSSILIATTLLALINNASPCQEGFMRHTVEIICREQGNCSYEYNEEILFNRIQNNLCINVVHKNKSIGTMKIKRKEMKLICSKVSHFYTRDTFHKIFHVTRCAEMGSCTGDICSTLRHNETIDELARAAKYPGYSACENTCGGLLCGCFLVTPACSFIRVANIPRNHEPYEVASCVEWRPVVDFEIESTFENALWNKTVSLDPYLSQQLNGTSLTIISLLKPHSPIMDKRFALAAHEALMIPNGYELPVECESKALATHEFNSCTNRMVCACSSFKTPKSCHCSGKTIRNIREDTSNVLPINTQTMQLIMEEGELQALTNEGEITLAVQSNFMVEFDPYVVDLPCAITMEPLQGCYNCLKGAQVVSHCTSSSTSSVTIHCTDNAFTIDCDQSNKTTTSTLHMAKAVVSQECYAKCAHKEINIKLRGTLHYHPKHIPNFTFEKTEEKNPAWYAIADFHLPDMEPLLKLIKKEWKIATAAIGIITGALAVTYLCGPTIILIIMKFCWVILQCASKIAWSLVTSTLEGSAAAIRTIAARTGQR